MPELKQRWRWYALGVLAIGTALIWAAVFSVESRRGRVFLHVLDVGQGDAILIESPGGNQVLIDGGPGDTVLDRLGERMPFWDRVIELVVLTHPHADHLDGLIAVLRRYRIGMVLESGVNHSIPEYALWEGEIARRGIPRVVARRGQIVRIEGDLALKVLAPQASFAGASPRNIHAASVVLRLAHASSTALLMADAEIGIERALIAARENLRAEILKVGHHGSKTSTSDALLRAVRPRFAAISAGRKNRYGHPTQIVLDRLAAFGARIYRTDRDGTVSFASDGRGFAAP